MTPIKPIRKKWRFFWIGIYSFIVAIVALAVPYFYSGIHLTDVAILSLFAGAYSIWKFIREPYSEKELIQENDKNIFFKNYLIKITLVFLSPVFFMGIFTYFFGRQSDTRALWILGLTCIFVLVAILTIRKKYLEDVEGLSTGARNKNTKPNSKKARRR